MTMKKKRDLTKGSIYKNLLWVAIPTLLSSLVQMAYNLTDMFWVSRVTTMGLDQSDAVTAVGTGGFYMWLGFGFIMLVKIGTSVNVSQAAGRNDADGVARYGANGFILMVFFAVFYSLLGFLFKEEFVGLFGYTKDIVISDSIDSLEGVSSFVIFIFLVNLFSGIYDGLGLTIMTFVIVATGLVFNMILDPFFILDQVTVFGQTFDGLGLTVKGAAIATVISQGLVLLIYILIYMSKLRPFDLHLKKYFSKEHMKSILRIGYPVGVQSILFTIIAVIITIMQAGYGEEVVATQRVGSQIEALAWMIASGFQVALASFVGQNYGAGRIDRVKNGYIAAMKILIPYGIAVNLLLFFFSKQLFGIFIQEPDTLKLGILYLRVLSVSQLFMILELATAGAFNGLGKTKYPSGVGIIGNFLRIPIAYVLALSLGYVGIWWAVSISSIVKGTVLVIMFVILLRKLCLRDVSILELNELEIE